MKTTDILKGIYLCKYCKQHHGFYWELRWPDMDDIYGLPYRELAGPFDMCQIDYNEHQNSNMERNNEYVM